MCNFTYHYFESAVVLSYICCLIDYCHIVVQRKDDSDEDVIVTSVGFADRQASQLAATNFDTATAIANLFSHVSQMPDSAHKHRLMKQVNYVFIS